MSRYAGRSIAIAVSALLLWTDSGAFHLAGLAGRMMTPMPSRTLQPPPAVLEPVPVPEAVPAPGAPVFAMPMKERKAAADDPSRDRMLLLVPEKVDVSEPFEDWITVGPAVSHKPVRARFEEPWQRAGLLRYRVSYLNPEGVGRAYPVGIEARLGGQVYRSRAEKFPERYQREYAVYHPGDRVQYELEIINDGAALPEMVLRSIQESFNPQGAPGRPLSALPSRTVLGPLPAGGRLVVRESFVLSSARYSGGSLEQTHITLSVKQDGSEGKVLLDAAQAGIVDPPACLH